MIEVYNQYPKNREHVSRLLLFCQEVLAVCESLNIVPVLSGSLAVFAYTQNEAMCVNDIDLACSELEFPKLSQALEAQGILHLLKPWHVLQARRRDLKVEFDSLEYWMADLPEDYETLHIGGCVFRMVSLATLQELYRRGFEATLNDLGNQKKHIALAEKYAALLG